MKRPLLLLIGTALSALATTSLAAESAANADVLYVTDELRLGLYAGEETSGRTLKTLISGARLDVLERSLMSVRVRTEDGDEGWVKTAYVTPLEPARRRLAAIEASREQANAQLANREHQIQGLNERVSELEAALGEAQQNINDLPALRSENASLKETLARRGITVPLTWFGLAALVALVAGVVLGYWWLDRRVRRHFGGVRPY